MWVIIENYLNTIKCPKRHILILHKRGQVELKTKAKQNKTKAQAVLERKLNQLL